MVNTNWEYSQKEISNVEPLVPCSTDTEPPCQDGRVLDLLPLPPVLPLISHPQRRR